ncbi:MAG: hypothetical protein AB7F22_05495 [Reyranella sp.]|uniref:hypothetical protein n=1 Tax=Reyranella sp. TaxID=1929291 RepID=UPI003D127469
MKFGDSTTHKPRAIAPQNFRAQATGVGQTTRASRMTGAARAQRVADQIPAGCRACVPEAEGYPAASPAMPEMGGPGAIYQTKVNGR